MSIKYAVIDGSGNIEALTNASIGNVEVDTSLFSTYPPMCYTYSEGEFVLKDNADELMSEIAERLEAEEAERVAAVEAEALAKAEEAVRTQRNALLAETDWMGLSDVVMSDEMTVYRQALRDITSHENFPNLEDADWPTKPE